MKHLNITIEGDVQGVGFRWAARAKAQALGVNGFVRNEVDGSVHVEAEAESPALDAFLAWCGQGPRSARVDRVSAREAPAQGFAGFAIRL